eukprot:tig00000980_g6156.t1
MRARANRGRGEGGDFKPGPGDVQNRHNDERVLYANASDGSSVRPKLPSCRRNRNCRRLQFIPGWPCGR